MCNSYVNIQLQYMCSLLISVWAKFGLKCEIGFILATYTVRNGCKSKIVSNAPKLSKHMYICFIPYYSYSDTDISD